MVHCAAIDCTNSSSKKNDENISFFKLPKDIRKKIWIAKLKRQNLPKDENVYVCHLHFEEACFKRDLKVLFILDLNKMALIFLVLTRKYV